MTIKVNFGNAFPPSAASGVSGQVANGLTAAGSTQGTALQLALLSYHVVTTAAASTGVVLPVGTAPTPFSDGDRLYVANLGANTLSIYPPVGGVINSLSANAAFSVGVGKVAEFICTKGGSAPTYVALLSA